MHHEVVVLESHCNGGIEPLKVSTGFLLRTFEQRASWWYRQWPTGRQIPSKMPSTTWDCLALAGTTPLR